MLSRGAALCLCLLPAAGMAQTPAAAVHVSYKTYAAGIPVAEVAAGFSLGRWTYQIRLDYHTVGVVGWFNRGHESDAANGTWNGQAAVPAHFLGQGFWHGTTRETDLAYQKGEPDVQHLVPPNDGEREPVPDGLRAHSVDTLSAVAQLIHVITETGRCDTAARTFDGRRATAIEAHTVGEETLSQTDRSRFSGKAIRCDFQGRLLGGFKLGDDKAQQSRPMHGSAWLAPVLPGGMPVPVRMTFQTRWFGDATMYLTDSGSGSDVKLAQGN